MTNCLAYSSVISCFCVSGKGVVAACLRERTVAAQGSRRYSVQTGSGQMPPSTLSRDIGSLMMHRQASKIGTAYSCSGIENTVKSRLEVAAGRGAPHPIPVAAIMTGSWTIP